MERLPIRELLRGLESPAGVGQLHRWADMQTIRCGAMDGSCKSGWISIHALKLQFESNREASAMAAAQSGAS